MKTIVPEKIENQTLLKDILEKCFGKRYRLPVLDSQGRPKYLIHRSIIDRFIAQEALKDSTAATSLKFEDFLSDAPSKSMAESYITVTSSSTLHQIKTLMERKTQGNIICSDAFVTIDGTANSKVIGWITNVDINKHAEV